MIRTPGQLVLDNGPLLDQAAESEETMDGLKHIGGMAALLIAILPAMLFSHVVEHPEVAVYIADHHPWLVQCLREVHVGLTVVLLLSGLAVNWAFMMRTGDDTLDELGITVVVTAGIIIAIPGIGMISGWIYLAFRATVAAAG
jgi:hypothetical protein